MLPAPAVKLARMVGDGGDGGDDDGDNADDDDEDDDEDDDIDDDDDDDDGEDEDGVDSSLCATSAPRTRNGVVDPNSTTTVALSLAHALTTVLPPIVMADTPVMPALCLHKVRQWVGSNATAARRKNSAVSWAVSDATPSPTTPPLATTGLFTSLLAVTSDDDLSTDGSSRASHLEANCCSGKRSLFLSTLSATAIAVSVTMLHRRVWRLAGGLVGLAVVDGGSASGCGNREGEGAAE